MSKAFTPARIRFKTAKVYADFKMAWRESKKQKNIKKNKLFFITKTS